jgi:hypothetical protein
VSSEVNIMLGELVGEFKGKNTGWRVLPDGKIETTAQGIGKILGINAFLVSTSVGTMTNGIFMGEVKSVLTTMEGETIMSKGIAVAFLRETAVPPEQRPFTQPNHKNWPG